MGREDLGKARTGIADRVGGRDVAEERRALVKVCLL